MGSSMTWIHLLLLLQLAASIVAETKSLAGTAQRSFVIDYDRDVFLKDGVPYQYFSGSIHYQRVPWQYWSDRLTKAKAAGLSAVQAYVPWNFHNPQPDVYDFSGDRNLTLFLQTAQRAGLDVILRVGPYTCGEWEHGGLPWWMLKIKDIRVRTSDVRYLKLIQVWFAKLFPMLVPLLYKNGGPIIMIQVENEYGSFYACDRNYMAFLRDLIRTYVGNDTVLFTVDGGSTGYLKCGVVPGVYPTVDFGSAPLSYIQQAFAAQRTYAPKGPLVNTEFYTWWFDEWGSDWDYANIDQVVASMSNIYRMNASLNFYMFEGGTNFGYMAAGENQSPFFSSVTTSYDYDAPLSEAGDPRPLYQAIRVAIEVLTGQQIAFPVPPPQPKKAYGTVGLQFGGTILDILDVVSPGSSQVYSVYPLSFIDLDFPFGFVLYETVVQGAGHNLSVPGISDRGYVLLDRTFKGLIMRNNITSLTVDAKPGQKLRILVENQGRICYGPLKPPNDFKGILANVTLDGANVTQWMMYPVSIENLFLKLRNRSPKTHWPVKSDSKISKPVSAMVNGFLPSIYYGSFAAETLADTFFDSSGWGKGQLFINGFNVGRYWPTLGPQLTLYVPKTMLAARNIVVAFELEGPQNCDWLKTCNATFLDTTKVRKTANNFKALSGRKQWQSDANRT